MRLPGLANTAAKTKRQIVRFGGINYSREYREGELARSDGLSSSQFPCLSQRAGRRTVQAYKSPTALYAAGDELCVVDGTDLIYGGKVVGQVTEGEKHFAAINTKLVIFPDKVCYDTADGKFSSLEASFEGIGGVSFSSNSMTAAERWFRDQEVGAHTLEIANTQAVTVYTGSAVDPATGALTMIGESSKAVSALSDGDLTREGCGEGEYLVVERVRQNWDGTWSVLGKLRRAAGFTCPDLGELFKTGDAVELSGCVTCGANNGSHIVRGVEGRTPTFDRDIFTQTGDETGVVTVRRKVPDLSCLCQCDNRLWGAEGQTIYASALGDPTNFFVFDGLSTDSYAVAVGSPGEFTGCCAYSSNVLFFKEDCIHRVLGSYPAQYTVYSYTVPGVQMGSEKSLAILNETLFYKGRNGVYAYTGGTPEMISECFGARRFDEARGGTDGERYYISMRGDGGEWGLYVFDTRRGVWLREDTTRALDFAFLDSGLYFLDGDTGRLVLTGQEEDEAGAVPWSATLCQFDEVTHGRKGYSRLYLRCDLEAGAWLKIEISADGGPFHQVFATHNEYARTAQIPILPTRCDSFRVRLSGRGGCVVQSLVREFSVGSEY